jgi:plastocyanin
MVSSRRRTIRRAAALAAAVLVPAAVAVTAHEALAASIRTVTVSDDNFTPNTVAAAQGDVVRWTWAPGSNDHTVTDNSGMSLYSTVRSSGSFQRTFTTAGGYPFRCMFHSSMSGIVRVALKAAPASGTAATRFTITWSTAAAAAGFTHDVQIKRPGTTGFVNWKTGIAAASAQFTPDAGKGTYQFKARLRKTSNNRSSAYSAPRSIVVS